MKKKSDAAEDCYTETVTPPDFDEEVEELVIPQRGGRRDDEYMQDEEE